MNRQILQTAMAVLVLAVFPHTPGAAQTGYGIITGRVTDSAGTPLPDTEINVVCEELSVVTGADGRFIIVGVPTGEQGLYITRDGYHLWWIKTTVHASAMPYIEAVLKKVRVYPIQRRTALEWSSCGPYSCTFVSISYDDSGQVIQEHVWHKWRIPLPRIKPEKAGTVRTVRFTTGGIPW